MYDVHGFFCSAMHQACGRWKACLHCVQVLQDRGSGECGAFRGVPVEWQPGECAGKGLYVAMPPAHEVAVHGDDMAVTQRWSMVKPGNDGQTYLDAGPAARSATRARARA